MSATAHAKPNGQLIGLVHHETLRAIVPQSGSQRPIWIFVVSHFPAAEEEGYTAGIICAPAVLEAPMRRSDITLPSVSNSSSDSQQDRGTPIATGRAPPFAPINRRMHLAATQNRCQDDTMIERPTITFSQLSLGRPATGRCFAIVIPPPARALAQSNAPTMLRLARRSLQLTINQLVAQF